MSDEASWLRGHLRDTVGVDDHEILRARASSDMTRLVRPGKTHDGCRIMATMKTRSPPMMCKALCGCGEWFRLVGRSDEI